MDFQRLPSGVRFPLRSMVSEAVTTEFRGEHGLDFPIFPHTVDKYQVQHSATDQLRCLPILGVSMKVRVADAMSRTSLTQTFTNFSSKTISEADYIFPLYHSSVVASFRCLVGDERVLVGTVKPKAEARAEYQRAVKRQEVAALLEEHTPEIFETKIGNIPPKTTVRVELEYVTELKLDLGGEGVLLTIPTSIAPRYGNTSVNIHGWLGDLVVDGLEITINVSCPDRIVKLESPTHPISIRFGSSQKRKVSSFPDLVDINLGQAGESQSSQSSIRDAEARLADPAATLQRDFVLIIQAAEDAYLKPRAIIAPTYPTIDQAAMLLSVSPRDLMSGSAPRGDFTGDIILVADQSRSMEGAKNKILQEILIQAVHETPKTARLNVSSFGSKHHTLWNQPRLFSQRVAEEAKSYISTFCAKMGGTELLNALEDIVGGLVLEESIGGTQVIVFTDAEVWGADETIQRIREWKSKFGDKIRFFAYGIGNEVSHHLLEGIATAGGGYADISGIDTSEDRKKKIQHMLLGASMSTSWSLSIDFAHLIQYDPAIAMPADEDGATWYIQSPREIPPLHPFSRTSIFILLKPDLEELPEAVTVRLSNENRDRFEIAIPTTKEKSTAPCIHHLAAKAITSELESLSRAVGVQSDSIEGPTALNGMLRDMGESLGCRYSIASRWTSFVAVDSRGDTEAATDFYRPAYNPCVVSSLCQSVLPSISPWDLDLAIPFGVDTSMGDEGDDFLGSSIGSWSTGESEPLRTLMDWYTYIKANPQLECTEERNWPLPLPLIEGSLLGAGKGRVVIFVDDIRESVVGNSLPLLGGVLGSFFHRVVTGVEVRFMSAPQVLHTVSLDMPQDSKGGGAQVQRLERLKTAIKERSPDYTYTGATDVTLALCKILTTIGSDILESWSQTTSTIQSDQDTTWIRVYILMHPSWDKPFSNEIFRYFRELTQVIKAKNEPRGSVSVQLLLAGMESTQLSSLREELSKRYPGLCPDVIGAFDIWMDDAQDLLARGLTTGIDSTEESVEVSRPVIG